MKTNWIVLVLLVLICGICAILFRADFVAAEKVTLRQDNKTNDSDRGFNQTDGEAEQLRDHITSLEATIAKLEDRIAISKIQTGLLSLPGLRGSLVGLPCVRIEIEDIPLDAVRYGLTKKNIRDTVEAQFRKHNIETLNPEAISDYSHDQILLWGETNRKPMGLHIEVVCPVLMKGGSYIGYIKVSMKHNGGELTPADHIERLTRFDKEGISTLEKPISGTFYETEWARTWRVYPGTGRLDSFAEDEKNALEELVGQFIEDYLAANPKGFVDYIYGYAGTPDNPVTPWTAIRGQMIHEGDIIDGVKVVKIHPFKHNADGTTTEAKVEFEKDGKRWTQGEEEPPAPEWQ